MRCTETTSAFRHCGLESRLGGALCEAVASSGSVPHVGLPLVSVGTQALLWPLLWHLQPAPPGALLCSRSRVFVILLLQHGFPVLGLLVPRGRNHVPQPVRLPGP